MQQKGNINTKMQSNHLTSKKIYSFHPNSTGLSNLIVTSNSGITSGNPSQNGNFTNEVSEKANSNCTNNSNTNNIPMFQVSSKPNCENFTANNEENKIKNVNLNLNLKIDNSHQPLKHNNQIPKFIQIQKEIKNKENENSKKVSLNDISHQSNSYNLISKFKVNNETSKDNVKNNNIKVIKIDNAKFQNARSKSPKLKIPFEKEMHQHGLDSKINDINKLNKYFENEIGSSRQLPTSRDCENELQKEIEATKKIEPCIIFPFQKRPRSNSPPKQFLATNHLKESFKKDELKPVIPVNFIMGGNCFKSQNKNKIPKKTSIENELIEMISNSSGLPTNPTDEDYNKSLKNENGEWLYKTLLEKDKIEKPEGDEDNNMNFLEMLNEMNDNTEEFL